MRRVTRRDFAGCLGVLLVSSLFWACARPGRSQLAPDLSMARLTIGDLRVQVGVADTENKREKGLMGVRALPKGTGVVFLFDGMTSTPFYMKDTLIPLDIAFWDDHSRIVDIKTMQPCKKDPCPLYYASSQYLGAAEVNAGEFSRGRIAKGDAVKLDRSP